MTENEVKIEGIIYSKNDPHIRKDCFTGDYFHIDHEDRATIGITLETRHLKPRKRFSISDPDTISTYRYINGSFDYRRYSEYANKLNVIRVSIYSINRGNPFTITTKQSVEEFIKENDLVKGINNPEIFYNNREIEVMDKKKPYRKFDNTYYKKSIDSLAVSPKSNSSEVNELRKNIIKRNQQMGVDSTSHQILEGKRYTFGVEIETSSGRLEEEDVRDLNVKAVHDGSLRGPNGEDPIGGEYVTGVLFGDSGFNQIHEICRVLQSKCEIDHRCGIHVHLGGMKWNKEDVIYSYILAEILENELFEMLPKSRRSNTYCRKLTPLLKADLEYLVAAPSTIDYQIKIDELYNRLTYEVAGTSMASHGPNEKINRNQQHPKGAKCGFDKKSQRYCWLNYVTLMFDTKGIKDSHTLEFRPMSATLNFKKIRNWIKICVAIVYFVENFKNIIKSKKYIHTDGSVYPLNLELVIVKAYPKTGGDLVDYIRERKQIFKSADESIDYVDSEKPVKRSIKEVICV